MPPNHLLVYENEDLERVPSYEKKGYRTVPILFVNGNRIPDKLASKARSNQTLLSYLREVLRLTGSKLGCAEGGCGACTVMLSKTDPSDNTKIRHASVNACLMPILAADGCHITTVEGVGTVKNDNLHPIQKAMTDLHGSQCGFCTPGIIVSIYALLANSGDTKYMEEHLDGNLCRCTGYRPIWDAARSLCDDGTEMVRGPCGTACQECPERDTCEQDCNVQDKAATPAGCCSSSSLDKVKMQETFINDNKADWKSQPNEMFPKDLSADSAMLPELAKPLMVVDRAEYEGGGTWFKPTTFVDMLALLKDYGTLDGGCKLVVGNTEVGIETKFKHAVYPRLIFPSEAIAELYSIKQVPTHVEIGACVPLSKIQHDFEAPDVGDIPLSRTVLPIHDMLRWFASTQIRNVACLGGNLVTASPISDMNPMLASLGATLTLSSLAPDGSIKRRSTSVSDFFLRYRTVNLEKTEIVEKIQVPLVQSALEYVRPFKQARRREDDISIVTSGMRIRLAVQDGKFVIDEAAIALGGMAPTTVMAIKTCEALKGNEFCQATFDAAKKVMLQEFQLPENVPGGQAAYRMSLAVSYLQKMFYSVHEDLSIDIKRIETSPAQFPTLTLPLPALEEMDAKDKSATSNFLMGTKPSYTGVQVYPEPKVMSGLEDDILPPLPKAKLTESETAAAGASSANAVGKASPHQSGSLHCTGEAHYVDDIPVPEGTLQACLVMAKECGSVLASIDKSPALGVPGVVDVYTAEDITKLGGKNVMGPIAKDETVFLPIGDMIQTVGQVLGVVVGETLEAAELGARSVAIQYGEQKVKLPVSIVDAIAESSFYESTRHTIQRGDLSLLEGLSDTTEDSTEKPKVGDVVQVSGSFRSGAQEHFYLETNSTLAVPSESDTNLTIYASTQAPTKTHTFCSSTTGTPAAKVVVRMKRMGGGFGGKETRSVFVSCAAAVAAKRSGRPVRLTLARDVDMTLSGTRHAFLSTYKASAKVTEDGLKMLAMDVQLYNNGGWALDLSGPVADRALFHVDNVYNIPNIRASAVCCKTAVSANTAFRGFGGPQGMVVAEHVLDHLAVKCGASIESVRRLNMYKDGDVTHFGTIMGNDKICGKWNIPTMWDRLYNDLGFPQRREEIDKFNSENKWIKRGLCLLPTKFGIAFTAKYMNQGGALVHVYTDGTVLVSHGGTEMGQGLHTKVCQVAAQAFGIAVDKVYVNDSSTDKVANTIPTAASMSTDMYGMATLNACRQIAARLEPVKSKLGPAASFSEVAQTAFMERIDLSAHGFFALDNSRCGYDFTKEKPEGVTDDVPENSWKGQPFNYFTQGVAYAEVEIDVLSGNHRTIRSDCLVDVGSSINPAIDIGQIEGAFIQGMGWSTMEEVVYSDDGHTWIRPRGKIFTTGPGTYKIPAFNDVPEAFNVSLMEDVDNPFAVHSSKAIGEPPFFLGTSVFYAIKDAVQSARKEFGNEGYFEMRMPATSERIRLHCSDSIASAAIQNVVKNKEESTADYQPQGSY